MIRTIPILLMLLLLLSCNNSNNSKTTTKESPIVIESTTTPSEALNLSTHGHSNVPKIAEKAHQNPAKTGQMQRKIRRGTPKKKRAMENTMNKKREFLDKKSEE